MRISHHFNLETHHTNYVRHHSFKYTIGAQSNAGLDQALYYDNLGWADEHKTLAEDDGGNTNPDNINDIGAFGRADDEETAGNLVTIKGDFVSDAAAEVSCALVNREKLRRRQMFTDSIIVCSKFQQQVPSLPYRETRPSSLCAGHTDRA